LERIWREVAARAASVSLIQDSGMEKGSF
jgi:hypothetical protein